MKKTGRSKQLLALILAGALTVGAVGTPVFGADFGDTAIEVSAEEEAVAEEITEEADNTAAEDEALDGSKSEEADNTAAEDEALDGSVSEEANDAEAEESDAGEVSDDAAVPEDNEDSNIEAYTVTLDANGGYFVDEWDDIKNCYADNVEILSKNIPIGGAVTSFPVREQDGSTIAFLGWSFERDGESITQENEEYIPVENCVLYAVWENRGNEKEISAVTEDSEGLYTDKEDGDFKEEDNNGFNTIEETDSTTVESEEQQDDTSQRTDMTADQPENQLADQPETNQAEEFLTDTSSEEVESIPSGEAEDLDSFSHDTEEALNDTGSDNGNDAAQNQDHPIVEVDEQEETTSEDAAESVAANGALGDNLTWTLDGEGVLTISGNGEMCSVFEALWDREKVKKVIIEAGVTSIGYGAFEYHSSLSSVVIPDSVTSIGGDAFISCTSLKSVIIPDSVISLGYSAFAYCSNLASVTMPEDLLRFSADAFEGTLWLDGLAATDGFTIVNGVLIRYIGDSSEVTIPHGVTIIGDSAFLRNENLTEVVIPSTVTEIGVGAFSECSNLAGITIPDEVTSIDAGAFTSCTSLANVTLPENLQVIETATFRNCTSLTNLTIPNSVTEIKSQAFSNCKLLDIALPENLIEIGKDAFFQSGLTTVTIPDKVKIIGSGAFMNCQALTSVTIPDGVTEIGGAAGGGAFYYCINLTDVTMPDGLYRCAASAFMSTPWLSTLLENTKDAKGFSIIHGILIGYSGAANEITIPDGVTIIGSEALSCRCLTSVTLPGSVNEIDSLAFSNNYNLTNIRIPASVTKIGDMAFEGCTFDGYDDSYSDFTIYGYAGSEAERYANKAGHTFIAIEQSLLTNATVTVEDKTYTGEEIKPVPDVKLNGKTLTADVDYTVSYSNNTNAGTATVKITGIGQYQGTVTKTFTIKKADPVLAFANTSVSKKTTDSSFTNTLTKTTDGTVTFSSSNTSVATVNSSSGQVTIKGTGNAIITANAAEGNNYKAGSASYSLTVSARSLSDCTMTVSPITYTYDGTEKKPTVTIKYNSTNLTINTDYTVSYSNNTNAGTGTVTATGKGRYSGTLSKTFTIGKASPTLSFASSSVSKTTTDSAFTNTLTKKTDGTVTFSSSNTSVATVNSSSGQVTIKGVGTTTITANAAEGANYKAGSASYVLKVNAQYTVTYNANGGTGTPSSQTKQENEALTLSSIKPTKRYTVSFNSCGGSVSPASKSIDCTFQNWNTVKDGSGTSYASGGSYTANSDAILYAQWTDPKAGELATPTRSGYAFTGWFTSASGGTLVDESTSINANVTLYAHWTDPYNLGDETYSFNNYGDTCPSGRFGHCFGMSMTSAGYYNKLLDINKIGGDENTPLYSFSDTPIVRGPICNYQNKQGTCRETATVAGGTWYLSDPENPIYNIESDWQQVVNFVKSHKYDGTGILQIGFRKENEGGHAVNFLEYKNVGGQDRIYAYDNNFPKQSTYFYQDPYGRVLQAPVGTFSGAIDCIALRDVRIYFEEVKSFDSTRVIYILKDAATVEGYTYSNMECDLPSDEEYVMYEIPADQDRVTIIPKKDNADFIYMGTEFSFGEITDETRGELRFSSMDEESGGLNASFIIYEEETAIKPTVTLSKTTFTYNGKVQKPTVTVKAGSTVLTESQDYIVEYPSNMVDAGTYKVKVTLIGKYSGVLYDTFEIVKGAQPIAASNLSLTYLKTGTVAVSGNKGKLTYKSSNTAVATVDSAGKVTAKGAGTAKITITATATSNYNAAKKTITVTVAKAPQSITAKAAASPIAVGKTTTVSITGNKGTKSFKSSDTTIATVSSSGKVTAKKVGKVTITATSAATSNYKAASKTVTIKVVPAATASLTAENQATGIKLTWKKVAGANAYFIYRGSTQIAAIKNGSTVTYTDKKANTNGTKYTYKIIASASVTGRSTLSKSVTTYCVTRPAISTLTNSASKKMTVKWGKNAKATGYQIQYCPDKTFKTGNKSVSITSASTVSKVIGSLAKGKTYYVRIRTFKTVGSTKYFSAWGTVKSVKISK